MLIPIRTLGDLLANLGALALGLVSYPVSIVILVLIAVVALT